jgi:hypothetical protein
MKHRLPIILSTTALVVAIAGITPLGEAASDAIPFARNADKVDGLHASRTPKAGRLLALDRNKKFPHSVLTNALRGIEWVTDSSANDSSSPKLVFVHCTNVKPNFKQITGGGARVTGAGAEDVRVTESYTTSEMRDSWTVRAVESPATGQSWQLTGTAICAPVPSGP